MIFVKDSHFVWDPSRQRKVRKKLGNLRKSPKDTLDEMLEEHLEEVQAMLLRKKSELDEMSDISSRTDDGPQAMDTGLRSPPLPIASQTPKHFEAGGRQENASKLLRSPNMPTVGMFGVTPKSPVKRSPF